MSVPAYAWPAPQAWEALEGLVAAARLPIPTRTTALAPLPASDRAALARWIDAAALSMALEAEPLHAGYGEIPALLLDAGPALLYLPGEPDAPCVVALVSTKRGRARLVTPFGEKEVPVATLEDALWRPVETRLGPRADAILDRAAVAAGRRERARRALIRGPVGSMQLDAGWTIRLPPSAPMRKQASQAGLTRAAVWMLVLTVLGHFLSLGAWALVGRGALGGTLDIGWLFAWALLLLTVIPVRIGSVWWQGVLGLGVSALLKRRLLLGALRLDPEEVRGQGTGQVLGRVIEAEAIESLVLNGGFAAVMAVIEVAIAGAVLAAG
ncbi:MAG TPA: ABC transporter ATP-binding protein, partial [Polyangiaceae bacterium]